MNLSMKQKQTHRHREQTCGCLGGGMRKRWIGILGFSRCKPFYIYICVYIYIEREREN